MIPSEVADIADLIWPEWREFEDGDPAGAEILSAAWRIYNAGYRREVAA